VDEEVSSLLPINLLSKDECSAEIRESILNEGIVIYDRELEKDEGL
jgi:hypothetical protein